MQRTNLEIQTYSILRNEKPCRHVIRNQNFRGIAIFLFWKMMTSHENQEENMYILSAFFEVGSTRRQ